MTDKQLDYVRLGASCLYNNNNSVVGTFYILHSLVNTTVHRLYENSIVITRQEEEVM